MTVPRSRRYIHEAKASGTTLISGIAAGLAAPYSTTSNGCFGPGLAVTIEATSANVLLTGMVSVSVAFSPGSTAGISVVLYRTTGGAGSIPAQGSAPGGTDTVITQAAIVTYENSSGGASDFNDTIPFNFTDTTAVAGTTYSYYFYISFASTPSACVIQGSNYCGLTALTGF